MITLNLGQRDTVKDLIAFCQTRLSQTLPSKSGFFWKLIDWLINTQVRGVTAAAPEAFVHGLDTSGQMVYLTSPAPSGSAPGFPPGCPDQKASFLRRRTSCLNSFRHKQQFEKMFFPLVFCRSCTCAQRRTRSNNYSRRSSQPTCVRQHHPPDRAASCVNPSPCRVRRPDTPLLLPPDWPSFSTPLPSQSRWRVHKMPTVPGRSEEAKQKEMEAEKEICPWGGETPQGFTDSFSQR